MKKTLCILFSIILIENFTACNVEKTVDEKITLTQFLGTTADNTIKINLHNMGQGLRYTEKQEMITQFYHIADSIDMTLNDDNEAAKFSGGIYIEIITRQNPSFVYISDLGEADHYSLFMSRLPLALYLVDDAENAIQSLKDLWDSIPESYTY